MKIAYIHGFLSTFDINNAKVKALSELGEIIGISYDSSNPFPDIDKARAMIREMKKNGEKVIVVGTSLGGFFAECIGRTIGVPYVAINSARNAHEHFYHKYLNKELKGYYDNTKFIMDRSYIDDLHNEYRYFSQSKKGNGLFIFDMGDDVLDNHSTMQRVLAEGYPVVCYEGGSHRFDHMDNAVEEIKKFAA